MKVSELIKKLEKYQKRNGNLEVRKGGYKNSTEEIESVYFDEDTGSIIIY